MAEFIMVDQILVAEREANDALHQQGFDTVLDKGRIAAVPKAGGKAAGQPDHPVGGAQQQGTGALVMRPPSNAAITARPSTRRKSNRAAVHCVGIGGVGIGDLLGFAARLCRRRTFADSEPRCT